ncbi:MAG: hypothetical protein K2X03_27125 [Bryobacteraceae bacterium]|nr:hypothetical protein [Bryobacteraceae bacterium]
MLSDTTPEADALMLQLRRQQTVGERLSASLAMSELVRSLQMGVLRAEHPQASEDEIKYLLAVQRLGQDLADRVFGPREG